MIALYDPGISLLRLQNFPAFSEIRNFPEIYMILSQGRSFPMLVFYIPRCRKTFPEFSGDFTLLKNQRACTG
jgi:hypothetical protein